MKMEERLLVGSDWSDGDTVVRITSLLHSDGDAAFRFAAVRYRLVSQGITVGATQEMSTGWFFRCCRPLAADGKNHTLAINVGGSYMGPMGLVRVLKTKPPYAVIFHPLWDTRKLEEDALGFLRDYVEIERVNSGTDVRGRWIDVNLNVIVVTSLSKGENPYVECYSENDPKKLKAELLLSAIKMDYYKIVERPAEEETPPLPKGDELTKLANVIKSMATSERDYLEEIQILRDMLLSLYIERLEDDFEAGILKPENLITPK